MKGNTVILLPINHWIQFAWFFRSLSFGKKKKPEFNVKLAKRRENFSVLIIENYNMDQGISSKFIPFFFISCFSWLTFGGDKKEKKMAAAKYRILII